MVQLGGLNGTQELQWARAAARERMKRHQMVFGFVVCCSLALSNMLHLPELPPVVRALVLIALFLALGGMAWFGWAGIRKEDQRLATMVPRRIAHSGERGLRDFAGAGFVVLWVYSFGGGFVLGLVLGFLDHGENAVNSFVFAGGTVLLGALSAMSTREILGRPTLAVDWMTLQGDDYLRGKDLRQALFPYPLLLALMIAAGGDTWVIPAGFSALGVVLWIVSAVVHRYRYPAVSAPPGRPGAA